MDAANATAFDRSWGLSLDDLLPESQRVHTPEPEYEIYEPEQPPATRRHRPRWRRWTMYVALVMLTPLALSEMVTLSYRWFTHLERRSCCKTKARSFTSTWISTTSANT